MSKFTTTDRVARAKALIAAAKKAREEFRAAPAGSLEKKALGLRAINALYIAQDAASVLREYNDDEIANVVSQIKLCALAGNPVRFEGELPYTDLLHEERIYLCRNGSLDVLGGPLAASETHTLEG